MHLLESFLIWVNLKIQDNVFNVLTVYFLGHRKHDYEMFLCTLLIPDPNLRTKVMALRAFNTEVALIRDQVSQKDIGLARLVFWKDAITQLYHTKKAAGSSSSYQNVPRQPTVLELTRVC